MPFNLRKRAPLSYYEPDEPKFDEYLYCEECSDFVYDYCAIHGPLLVVPDDKVPTKTDIPSYVPRAALTIPNVFLHLAPSIIPGAGLGVFSTLTLPRGVRFGPYRGQRTHNVDSMYCWQIYNEHNRRSHVIDAADGNSSNWMRYVNCARHWKEQNLLAYQYKGQLYYRTIKIIPRFTELMVFYGSEFANALNINLTKYNNAKYYKEVTYIPRPLKTQKTIIQSHEIHTEEYFNIIEEDTNESNSNQTVSEITDTNINSPHAKVSENKLIDPSSMETEKPENLLDQASIEDFKFFKTNDESHSKSPTNTEINTRIDSPKENNGKILKKCEFCGKIMTRKHYNSHKQKHLNPDRYSCPFCSYKTFRRYALNQHIGKHTKKYKYSCDYCSFETNYGRNFRQHREKHENGVVQPKTPVRITEKICQVCGFKSFSRSVIDSHRKKHRNVKFSCDLCSFSTFHKFSLKRHCYSVHPSK